MINLKKERYIKIFNQQKKCWIKSDFCDLKKYDKFKIHEKNGTLVTDQNGKFIHKAASDSFINKDGDWDVNLFKNNYFL